MAQYRKTIDIWTLNETERRALQPGQWITAGKDGPIGRYAGQTWGGVDVAQWRENARRSAGGMLGHFRRLRAYVKQQPGEAFR